MRNLFWKEWHEHNWKLTFSCIVLTAIMVIGLHSRMIADAKLIQFSCFVSAALLSILSSTGLVPAERAEGSFESLLAMPIAPWRMLAAKTAMGLILCVGPLATAAAATVLVAGGREVLTTEILGQYARAALTTVSLFIWMMALTVRMPSETRASLLAVGVLIIWSLISAGLTAPSTRSTYFAISPLAFIIPPSPVFPPAPGVQITGPSVLLSLSVQIFVLIGLWGITLRLFVAPTEDRP